MTAAVNQQTRHWSPNWTAIRDQWARRGGLDGVIRVGGAVAVVVTIEALAGYFLWRGTTEQVRIPAELGWALQFGLTGGSVVGTRAFHRGHREDKWLGFATSIGAVVFVIFDASMAALLLNGIVTVNAGWLAVGVLVEILVIGYLTVHTLMAARGASSAAGAARDQSRAWGPPDTVTDHAPATPEVDAAGPDATVRVLTPRRPLGTPSVPGWTKRTARARAAELKVSQAGTVEEIVARSKEAEGDSGHDRVTDTAEVTA